MTYKLVKLNKFIKDLTTERIIEISDSDIIEEPTLKTKTHSLEVKTIVNGSNIKVKKRVLLKEGDLVFAKLHTQNGAFAFAKKDFKSTTTFIPCKVDISQCREDFLYIVLDKYIKFLEITNDGVGRETFKSSDILNLEIPLPTLEEQEKIVKKLKSINGKIEKIKLSKEKNNIKILREQILKQAIEGKLVSQNPNDEPASVLLEKIKQEKEKLIKEGKLKKEKELPKITKDEIPFEIPENWVWCRLGEIGNKVNSSIVDGPFGSSININQDYIEKGIPVVRMLNVKPNKFIENDFKYVSKEKFESLARHNILSGDLLFSKVGAGIGECCIVPETFQLGLISTTGVSRFRVGEIVNNKFLLYFLLQEKDDFVNIASSSAQPFLNMTTIKNTLFPLPPLEEQKRIVKKIEEFEVKLNKLDKLQTKQLHELEALKNAVLDKALSGELI